MYHKTLFSAITIACLLSSVLTIPLIDHQQEEQITSRSEDVEQQSTTPQIASQKPSQKSDLETANLLWPGFAGWGLGGWGFGGGYYRRPYYHRYWDEPYYGHRGFGGWGWRY